MRSKRAFDGQIGGGADGQGVDWLAYLVIVAGVTLWFGMSPLTNGAFTLVLSDPDNYMRLVQVRDWLGGQSWWDTTQYRVDPPTGLTMHWSRLADVPLGLMIALFGLFADDQTAEMLAVVILPPVLLLFTAIFMGRTARNVGGAAAETWARLLVISATFVLVQYIPGRVDHHGLQLLLLAAALMSATAEPSRRSGMLVALPTALSLLIGLENVVLLLAIPVWMALLWLVEGGRERQAQLQGYALGIIIALPAFYAASVGPADWGRPTYDEIGRGHIAIVVAAGLGLLVALRTTPAAFGRRLALLGAVAVVALLPLLAFPEVLSPPYSAIDPMLQRLWMDAIAETKSAAETARTDPFELINYFWFSGLALIAGGALYLTAGRKPALLLILLVAAAALGVSLWQVRGMPAASLLAVLVAAIVGSHLWAHRQRRFGLAFVAAAVVLLNGWTGPYLYSLIAPGKAEAAETAEGTSTDAAASCETLLRDTDLSRVPPGLVLNGINAGGLILARTPHSVIAASNHRAVDSNREAYRIFLAPSSEARAALVRNKIDYVLTCRDVELQRLADIAPGGFAADLEVGRIPGWLSPIPHKGGKDLMFYTVSGGGTSAENPETPGGPSE